MKKILSHPHLLSFAGNALAALMGFLNISILARVLTPDDLGVWLIYLTAFTFADMLRAGVIHTALVRFFSEQTKNKVSGSAWVIGLVLSVILSSLGFLASIAFPSIIRKADLTLSAVYFPFLYLASLPFNIGLWLQQAQNRFQNLLYLRLILTIPFFSFVISGFFVPFNVETLIKVHISCYTFTSIIALLSGWTLIIHISQATVAQIKQLLRFGKYSMGTLLGTNLLKSADTFMISWYLGPAAVAMYNLPYKLIELVEIPLRSLVATSLPRLSECSHQHNMRGVRHLFNQYVGFLTLAIIPVAIVCFIWAEWMVVLLGGKSYAASSDIFRVFVIYSLLLPLDRFIGVTLDSVNKPHLNFFKVTLMVLVNITANLVVLELIGSPLSVAVTTIITILAGVIFGTSILHKIIKLNSRHILTEGYLLFTRGVNKLIRSATS